MKEKIQRNLALMTGKAIQKVVNKEQGKWPPHCAGILHQPKRPRRMK